MSFQIIDNTRGVVLQSSPKELALKALERINSEADVTLKNLSKRQLGKGKRLMSKKKATEDQFNELHNLVTQEFLARVKSAEASTADLKAACDWLKTNDISGIAVEGNPLAQLANIMPQVDPELVQTRLYGKR